MPMLLHQSHSTLNQAETLKQLLHQLALRTPLWRMACTIDPQAAHIAYAAMSDTKNEEATL